MSQVTTDRIEKKILLRAPRARIWKALVDSSEFGTWFGVRFDGPFVVGQPVHGVIVPTRIDRDVAAAQQSHAGKPFDVTIERIEPERIFAFRWHPYAVDPNVDYSLEPTTLVTFQLDDAPDGIMLTVTESGFDRIPLARRADAFTGNEQGWTHMVRVFETYIGQIA